MPRPDSGKLFFVQTGLLRVTRPPFVLQTRGLTHEIADRDKEVIRGHHCQRSRANAGSRGEIAIEETPHVTTEVTILACCRSTIVSSNSSFGGSSRTKYSHWMEHAGPVMSATSWMEGLWLVQIKWVQPVQCEYFLASYCMLQ